MKIELSRDTIELVDDKGTSAGGRSKVTHKAAVLVTITCPENTSTQNSGLEQKIMGFMDAHTHDASPVGNIAGNPGERQISGPITSKSAFNALLANLSGAGEKISEAKRAELGNEFERLLVAQKANKERL